LLQIRQDSQELGHELFSNFCFIFKSTNVQCSTGIPQYPQEGKVCGIYREPHTKSQSWICCFAKGTFLDNYRKPICEKI